jgi:hypothetical protein
VEGGGGNDPARDVENTRFFLHCLRYSSASLKDGLHKQWIRALFWAPRFLISRSSLEEARSGRFHWEMSKVLASTILLPMWVRERFLDYNWRHLRSIFRSQKISVIDGYLQARLEAYRGRMKMLRSNRRNCTISQDLGLSPVLGLPAYADPWVWIRKHADKILRCI